MILVLRRISVTFEQTSRISLQVWIADVKRKRPKKQRNGARRMAHRKLHQKGRAERNRECRGIQSQWLLSLRLPFASMEAGGIRWSMAACCVRTVIRRRGGSCSNVRISDEGFGITGLEKGSVRDTRKVTRKVSRMTGMIER
jgi:hypothetical protein